MTSESTNNNRKTELVWTRKDLSRDSATTTCPDAAANASASSCILCVSNASVPISPKDVQTFEHFVTPDQESSILDEIQRRTYVWEGFDQRRRVQRYQVPPPSLTASLDHDIPPSLLNLCRHFTKTTGLVPQHIAVEWHPYHTWSTKRKTDYASNHVMATFDIPTQTEHCPTTSTTTPSCTNCYFSAHIPIGKTVIQQWNRPAQRTVHHWTLTSPNHWTFVRLLRGSLVIRTGDVLYHWRTCNVAAEEGEQENDDNDLDDNKSKEDRMMLILKLYSLPDESTTTNVSATTSIKSNNQNEDDFGYIASKSNLLLEQRLQQPQPSMQDLLTIVITTSPIKSNPSTEVLERAMETFRFGGTEFCFQCRKVIVCDGFRTKDEKNSTVTRKHSNVKQAMRNGIVTSQQAENYIAYKAALRKLCDSADETSPFQNTVVEELDSRYGYGFALRHALRHCVSTEFVCVIQHDRSFMRPTPIQEAVDTMWNHPNIKYIGMSMRSNLMYRDHFQGKYGNVYMDDFDRLCLRPPELVVDASKFGPDSESTRAMAYPSGALKENIESFSEAYRISKQYAAYQQWLDNLPQPLPPNNHQMSLTPTFFWFDNVHIAETAHYRDFVFNPRYKMVARGGFVEDKLSPVIKKTVERLGLVDGHSRFGCYLLDDHSGMFFTGHLDGGSYITEATRKEILDSQKTTR